MEAPEGRQYDHLPNDVIREIALKLPLEDVLNNCRTSKKFNEIICNNETFWLRRLKQEFPTFTNLKPFLVEVNEDRVKVFVRNTEKGLAQSDKTGIMIYDALGARKLVIKLDGELYKEKLVQFDNVVWIFPGNNYFLNDQGLKEYGFGATTHDDIMDRNSLLLDLGNNKYAYIGSYIYTFTSYAEIIRFYAPVDTFYGVRAFAVDVDGNVYFFNSNQLYVLESNPELNNKMSDSRSKPYGFYGTRLRLLNYNYNLIANGHDIRKNLKAAMNKDN